ncbi:signal peptidase I [Luteolibacter marinus]|uniref:signal peptidase I n=1 Tax=Luteolibacter marinus TaxID=2776705 RepID=UPI001D02C497|nr:signal peptidase I [Luteolibacter marinus]
MLSLKPFSAISIAAVVALSACSKETMRQSSSNMDPTIKRGETVSVDLAAYERSKPDRWDVILFESPISNDGHWLGRVVGLPGETLEIRAGSIIINGKEEAVPPHLNIGAYLPPKTENMALGGFRPVTFPHKIDTDGYFVLGDNVSNSLDSRYWGDLEASKIVGQVPRK